jgi:anti-sigma factor RsiW
MPDPTPSDDELLSSHLDGELTAEAETRLRARLAAEPDLRARLTRLRSASELASTPPSPLRAGDRDRLITAALAVSSTSSAVVDLDTARDRRRVWRSRIVAVAAVVAALAVTVPVLVSLSSDDDFDTADSATADDDAGDDALFAEAGGADAGGDTAGEADAAMADSAPPDDLSLQMTDDAPATGAMDAEEGTAVPGFDPLADDLGLFATRADLDASVIEAYERSPTGRSEAFETEPIEGGDDTADTAEDGGSVEASPSTTTFLPYGSAGYLAQIGGCPGGVDRVDESSLLVAAVAADYATAEIAGQAVVVGIFELADGSAALSVLDLETCAITAPVIIG